MYVHTAVTSLYRDVRVHQGRPDVLKAEQPGAGACLPPLTPHLPAV